MCQACIQVPHASQTCIYTRCWPLQVSGEGVFGAGAHSDYGMLTLLATDEVPGLQVRALIFFCLFCYMGQACMGEPNPSGWPQVRCQGCR
jgi:isopenicillin N synthase-like dioxygenase